MDRECIGCGTVFKCYKSDKKLYCSKECRHAHLHTTRKCKHCGIEFEILKSLLKTNASGNYCSTSCYHSSGRNIITCKMCGQTAVIKKHRGRKFCSHKCATQYNSKERHYRWVGPENKHTTRGRGWATIRAEVLTRDAYTCQKCGLKVRDNDRVRGSAPDVANVHHIIPYRETKDNSLSNLVTLCPSCHMKIEWGTEAIA